MAAAAAAEGAVCSSSLSTPLTSPYGRRPHAESGLSAPISVYSSYPVTCPSQTGVFPRQPLNAKIFASKPLGVV